MSWELVPNKNCPGLCAYPNLCYEPASFSAPDNILSLCLAPGLSPKDLTTHFYAIPAGNITFWFLGILGLGIILGIFIGATAYHFRRHRQSVSFERGALGRNTLARLRSLVVRRAGDHRAAGHRPEAFESSQV